MPGEFRGRASLVRTADPGRFQQMLLSLVFNVV